MIVIPHRYTSSPIAGAFDRWALLEAAQVERRPPLVLADHAIVREIHQVKKLVMEGLSSYFWSDPKKAGDAGVDVDYCPESLASRTGSVARRDGLSWPLVRARKTMTFAQGLRG